MSVKYDSDSFDNNKLEVDNLLELFEENVRHLSDAKEIIEELKSIAIKKVSHQIGEFEHEHHTIIEEVETLKTELNNIDTVSINKFLPKKPSRKVDIDIKPLISEQKIVKEVIDNIKLEASESFISWMASKEAELNDSFSEGLFNPIDEIKQGEAERIYRKNKKAYDNFMDTAKQNLKFDSETEDIATEQTNVSNLDNSIYPPIMTIMPHFNASGIASAVPSSTSFGILEGISAIGLGGVLGLGTVLEDVFTGGAGLVDDPYTLAIAAGLITTGINEIIGRGSRRNQNQYNSYTSEATAFMEGSMTPNELCDFLAESYAIYSKGGTVTEYLEDIASKDQQEFAEDMGKNIDGILMDEYELLPSYGDSCANLAQAYLADNALNGIDETNVTRPFADELGNSLEGISQQQVKVETSEASEV